jgi:hypothetical protein
MKYAMWALAAVVAVVGVAYAGLLWRPSLFAAPATPTAPQPVRLVPLPADRPAPVARWYATVYPDGLPAYRSLAMRGTGVMRIGPVEMPFRHQAQIRPGEGFVRRMDLTWFDRAILHGLDTYADGTGRMVTPVGPESGSKIDQGANMASWLEALAAPGVLETHPGVRWEPVDDTHARLIIPLGGGSDELVVGFDPVTARPVTARAMRFRGETATERSPWLVEMSGYRRVEGGLEVATKVDVTWVEMGKPWATFIYDGAWADVAVPEIDAVSAPSAAQEADR